MGHIDSDYWGELARLNPETVCIRALADYQVKQRGYTLPILNKDYLVLPYQREIKWLIKGSKPIGEDLTREFTLMVLFYLLHAKNIPLARNGSAKRIYPVGKHFSGVLTPSGPISSKKDMATIPRALSRPGRSSVALQFASATNPSP